MNPYARFRAWMGWRRLTQSEAAKLLGTNQPAIGHLCSETRMPDMELAAAIEAATENDPDCPLGAIRPREWVEWAREKTAIETTDAPAEQREASR